MNGQRLIEVYADTRGVATCSGQNCRQRILWATVVKSGKRMCFNDPEAVALKTRYEVSTYRLIESLSLDDNHWATCADRAKFSSTPSTRSGRQR